MRVCLVSTHTDQTIGYSKIAGNLLTQFSSRAEKDKNNVKIFHFGFQRHAARANIKKVPSGVVSYDAAANEDPKEDGFGYNKFKEYLEMVQPDVVMIYNDILTISKFLDAMMLDVNAKATNSNNANPPVLQYDLSKKPKCKLWLYLDVMYEGMHPALVKKVFSITDRIYVFSRTAQKQMIKYSDEALYGPLPEVSVLEHAVDQSVFFPVKQPKIITRTQLGVPPDGILFLNCNRNSARKRLDLSIMAFARLLAKQPTLPLYFVFATGGVSGSKPGAFYDIPRMYMEEMKKLGMTDEKFKKRLVLIDTSVNVINDECINELYNLCEIGVNTSTGEGYGLCTFEHMIASGAAQIVTDTGCYSEYLKSQDDSSLAVIVPKSDHGYFDIGQSAFGFEFPVFDIKDIVQAYETCVLHLDEWKRKSRSIQLKTWEEVTENLWEDILKINKRT